MAEANIICESLSGKTKFKILPIILGVGASSTVMLAQEIDTGTLYACKKIPITKCYNLKSINNEILILKKFKHGNIISFKKAVKTLNNEIFILTEYCNYTLVTFKMPMPAIFTIRKILKDILNGLIELKKHEIIHRDLKPSNIYIKITDGDNFVTKIGDFGISKDGDMGTSFVGSRQFQAPEISPTEESSYSYSCDIWSLGVIAYKLVTNQLDTWVNGEYNPELYIRTDLKVSPYMLCFLYHCLKFNVSDRITAEKALELNLFKVPDSELVNEKTYSTYIAALTAKKKCNSLYVKINIRDKDVEDV